MLCYEYQFSNILKVYEEPLKTIGWKNNGERVSSFLGDLGGRKNQNKTISVTKLSKEQPRLTIIAEIK